MIIVFEGIDGSGKTTICSSILRELEQEKHSCIMLKEPSCSEYGDQFRSYLCKGYELSRKEQINLLIKDRIENVKKNILPAIKNNNIVLMDRYYFSHVYQAEDIEDLHKVIGRSERFAPPPNVVFLLDLPVSVALKRIYNRKQNDTIEKNVVQLNHSRDLYLYLSEKYSYFETIDANQPFANIVNNILSKLRDLL